MLSAKWQPFCPGEDELSQDNFCYFKWNDAMIAQI